MKLKKVVKYMILFIVVYILFTILPIFLLKLLIVIVNSVIIIILTGQFIYDFRLEELEESEVKKIFDLISKNGKVFEINEEKNEIIVYTTEEDLHIPLYLVEFVESTKNMLVLYERFYVPRNFIDPYFFRPIKDKNYYELFLK